MHKYYAQESRLALKCPRNIYFTEFFNLPISTVESFENVEVEQKAFLSQKVQV